MWTHEPSLGEPQLGTVREQEDFGVQLFLPVPEWVSHPKPQSKEGLWGVALGPDWGAGSGLRLHHRLYTCWLETQPIPRHTTCS